MFRILTGICLCLTFVKAHDEHNPRFRRSIYESGRNKQSKILEENQDFWLQDGENEIKLSLKKTPNTNIAKNIIIFIGDGMSLPTVAAARIFKGQQEQKEAESKTGLADFDGNSVKLSWENFPYVGLSMTYNSDYMVPDSASTAFAMYSGVKTSGYTMGFDNTVGYMELDTVENATRPSTILDWAQDVGMKTGFVTTTRMSHATPAALYSKTASRFWECENDILDDIEDGNVEEDDVDFYKPDDITKQLVESEAGKKIDVMLGGGRASWLPRTDEDTRWDYNSDDWNCTRFDQRNLIDEWLGNHTDGVYVETREQLMNLTMEEASVLGIFTNSYVTWDHEVNETNNKPRLEDMAVQAVRFLQKKAEAEDTGFFIMIEAGRIDQGHHNGQATTALSETVALDRAVEAVMNITDTGNTLVLVTADHSHTMTIGGYNSRFHDITGVVEDPHAFDNNAKDGEAFSILSYGNGPGFYSYNGTGEGDWKMIDRNPLDRDKAADHSFLQPSGQPLDSETHGGDDVGIWAVGPMSHLIHGTHQQSYIAHVMAYSACIGPYSGPGCRQERGGGLDVFSSAEGSQFVSVFLAVAFIFAQIII